jgi:hypothetical protein
MAEKNTEQTAASLNDEQITSERKIRRRSFLASTGALLVGAAAVAGMRATAQDTSAQSAPEAKPADPDAKKASGETKGADPDAKKKSKKKSHKKAAKAQGEGASADPDKAKTSQ